MSLAAAIGPALRAAREAAGVAVVYRRNDDDVAVTATVGKTEFELDDGAGIVAKFQSRDFLIAAADLVLAGSPTLPAAGDLIRETQGATTFVYEVMAPGDEPHYRFADPFRQWLRLHTKQVATE